MAENLKKNFVCYQKIKEITKQAVMGPNYKPNSSTENIKELALQKEKMHT